MEQIIIFSATVIFCLLLDIQANKFCINRLEGCEGSELDCLRSVPCHHGECDEWTNLCLCQPCWLGTNCNQYVDKHEPKFSTPSKEVLVSVYDSGILFKATAFDEDDSKTCGNKLPCQCAQIRYAINSGNEDDIFQIHPVEGYVSLSQGKSLEESKVYQLVVTACKSLDNGTIVELTNRNSSKLEVTLLVKEASEDSRREIASRTLRRSYQDNNKAEIHHRSKRATGGNSNETVISLTQVVPKNNATTTRSGEKAQFRLEITLPANIEMDVNLEVLSADPDNGNVAFSICDVTVEQTPKDVEYQEMFPGSNISGINDRAVLDFGMVSVAGQNTKNPMVIIITVVMIDNWSYISNGNDYSIFVGVSYDKDSNIWVGQASLTAENEPDKVYPSNLEADGPNTIAVDGYGLYTMHLITTDPIAVYTIDIFGNDDAIDTYSSGPLILTHLGKNFPCVIDDLLSYSYRLITSDSQDTRQRASLKTGTIINCDPNGRSDATDMENEMLLKFLLYIPNNSDLVGNVISIGATVLSDDKEIWVNILNITVTARETATQSTPTMTLRNANVIGSINGTAVVVLEIKLTETTYSDIIIESLAPETATDSPAMSICDIKTSSGANLPFVPMKAPDLASRTGGTVTDQLNIDYGRIWCSDMIPGNTTASTLTLNIYVRVLDESADGQSVFVKLLAKDGSTVSTQTATVVLSPSTEFDGSVAKFDANMNAITNQDSLAIEAEASAEVTVSVPVDSNIDSLLFKAFGFIENETIQARICRVELSMVDDLFVCVNKKKINEAVQFSKIDENGEVYDLAQLQLKNMCTRKDVPVTNDARLRFSIAAELLDQPTAIEGEGYTLYSGLYSGNSLIWVGATTYTVSSTNKGSFSRDYLPDIKGFLAPSTSATAGSQVGVHFRIQIPPKSSAAYKLMLTVAAGQKTGICKVVFTHIGHNFPCVDSDPVPGNTSKLATTRLNYDQRDETLGNYLSAVLDFGSISNIGSKPYNTGNIDDGDNTIKVAAIIKLDPDATGNVTIKYDLQYSGKTSPAADDVVISIVQQATQSTSFLANPNVTFETSDGTNEINVHLAQVLVFKIEITEESALPVSVTFSNDGSNKYGFCSAAVIKVGKNIPCLNATTVIPKSNDTLTEDSCKNSLTVPLGSICHIPLNDNPDEDWVTIEIGMSIVDPQLTGSVVAKATVAIGSSINQINPLTLAVNTTTPVYTTQNVTVTLVESDGIPVYIRQRQWVDVNLTIPKDAVVRLDFAALGAEVDSRAVITLSEVKISAAGMNVACIKNSTTLPDKIVFNSSANVTTSQKSSVYVDFGYVRNTALSYHRGNPEPWDDQVTISVEAMMTDHPVANIDQKFPITFLSDGAAFLKEQHLTVVRNGTEKPRVTVLAEVLNQKIFKPKEIIEVQLILSHARESLAEPTATIIRLFLPDYMDYQGPAQSNTSISEDKVAKMITVTMTQPFLFDDISHVNITLQVDPNNKRGHGAGIISATTLGRILAHVTQRKMDNHVTDSKVLAGSMFHMLYSITGNACNDSLGMESGRIEDCQLSASTVTTPHNGPSNARLNWSNDVWRPALRNNGHLDYLQVDFGNLTRVSQVAIQKDDRYRAPASVLLQYSKSGMRWIDGHKESNLTYDEDNTTIIVLEKPIETRFLRMLLTEIYEPDKRNDKYVSIRVEFYGCTLTGDVPLSDVCLKAQKTINSNDVMQYRHFSVATKSMAVFACDIKAESWDLGCFCSADGSKWKSLPSHITNIIGYDEENGIMFATSSRNTSIAQSTDCIQWLASTDDDLKKAMANKEFKVSSVVAGLSQNDPNMTKIIDKWKATYDGLYLNGKKRLGWSL